MRFLRARIAELFGIDPRALVALRIGLATLLLYDLLRRLPDLRGLYSDAGALPRQALEAPTIYALSGSPWFAALLFAITGCVALMLLVGYHTWLANAAAWFLVVSLLARNTQIGNSGDHLFSLLFFWGLFLPLGAHGSVDSRISRPRNPLPGAIVSVATLAILLQVIYPYVFSALIKSHKVWVTDSVAIYNALHLDLYGRPAAGVLLRFPGFVRISSPLIYWFELYGPFLAFVPFLTGWFRGITALVFIGFHVALALLFEINLFAYVCMVAWMVFLPAGFWDLLASWGAMAALGRRARALLDRLAGALRSPLEKRPWLAPPPDDGRSSLPGNLAAAVVTLYLLAWNVGTVSPAARMPPALAWAGTQLYIGQKWEMFATPPLDDGWWVMPARLRDGSTVDLFARGAAVTWDKPRSVRMTFPNPRWRRYLEFMWHRVKYRPNVVHYASWLRNEWNSGRPSTRQVESMEIYFVVEWTRPDYRPPIVAPQKVYTWSVTGDEWFPTPEQSRQALRRDLEVAQAGERMP